MFMIETDHTKVKWSFVIRVHGTKILSFVTKCFCVLLRKKGDMYNNDECAYLEENLTFVTNLGSFMTHATPEMGQFQPS